MDSKVGVTSIQSVDVPSYLDTSSHLYAVSRMSSCDLYRRVRNQDEPEW
jgi:hypothetical protein